VLHPVQVVAGHDTANVHAFHLGLLVTSGVAITAAVAALWVRDADAAPTMMRRRPAATAMDEAATASVPGAQPDVAGT
jgi:hypothetical protein